MTTTSTKLNPKKSVSTAITTEDDGLSERTWWISAVAILVVGAIIRLFDLSLVPLHHDEGVNGNFLVSLVREGKYTYNPENYHGPTLYYFSAIIPWVMRFFRGRDFGDAHGLTTFNIRLVTVVFGVATIGLALLLRKRLGTIGALSAAALIAVSPGTVYFSRYFIHESLYVFFTLGIVVAALKYYDTGHATYLILAAISAALMVATKETWIINGPVLLIALFTTSLYFWLRRIIFPKSMPAKEVRSEDGLLARFGGPVSVATVALIAFTVFIVVNVLFYSSFFTNYPKGVNDALRTLTLWRKRTHEHEHGFLQYFSWLRQMESPILLLGAVGAAIAVWRADNKTVVFIAQWAFGLLLAYSLVGYKTPWLCLNFIVPLALIGGYGLERLYRQRNEAGVPLMMAGGAILMLALGSLITVKRGEAGAITGVSWDFNITRHWMVLVLMLGLALYAGYTMYSKNDRYTSTANFAVAALLVLSICGYQMYKLNFVNYDDDRYAYVYAHTRRETLVLVDQIDRIANQMKTGQETGIALLSPEYWPLPWYFRNYKRVGYYQHVVPTTEPIVIAQGGVQDEEVENILGAEYQKIDSATLNDPRVDPQRSPNGSFCLRPGVNLLLYVRRDVAK